jgi:hypothetical protein
VLDPGVRGRTWFAAIYLIVQASLVFTAGLRPDGVFSFRMFNESSRILIALGRRVATPGGGTTVVPLEEGEWETLGPSGGTLRFAWIDRVRDPILATTGLPRHASYGVAAQLFRLQKALDDMADHLDGDRETRAIVADVRIWQNGRAPFEKRLESRPRFP